MSKIHVKVIRDRIQFEDCVEGETGRETAVAALAWEAGLERALPFACEAKAAYGKDHHKFECYVSVGEITASRCGSGGKIKLFRGELTAAQRRFVEPIFAQVDLADERGWEEAREAAV